MTDENWKKTVDVRLGEEPFPAAEYECTKCGYVWPDTDDPRCVCADDVAEGTTCLCPADET